MTSVYLVDHHRPFPSPIKSSLPYSTDKKASGKQNPIRTRTNYKRKRYTSPLSNTSPILTPPLQLPLHPPSQPQHHSPDHLDPLIRRALSAHQKPQSILMPPDRLQFQLFPQPLQARDLLSCARVTGVREAEVGSCFFVVFVVAGKVGAGMLGGVVVPCGD